MVDDSAVTAVPASHRDLLDANGFAFLATTGPDAAPQVSPTWYLWDHAAGQLLISLTTGRQKYRNLRRDPHVAVCIPDPTNPYRHLELRGTVESTGTDHDRQLINALTRKYVGQDEHTLDAPDDVRVVVRITPRQVRCFDLDQILEKGPDPGKSRSHGPGPPSLIR